MTWVDCLMWALIGLGIGGITGFCIGIISVYIDDLKIDDYMEDYGDDSVDGSKSG